MPISVIDIFAGPGGLNEGFSRFLDGSKQHAFRTAISVEMEPCAHSTLELRALYRRLAERSDTDAYYQYMRAEITREQLFEKAWDLGKEAKAEAIQATLGKSDVDNLEIEQKIAAALKKLGDDECVLIGGPPCQAYSLVGRARRTNDLEFEDDHKHFLYREYLNIVKKFKPAAFVMENVPGLLSAKMKGSRMFEMICRDLKSAGYTIHPISPAKEGTRTSDDPRDFVIHAEEFGVPQARSRIFLLGLRDDLKLRAATLPKLDARVATTVVDVLADLPKIRSRLSKEEDSAANWLAAVTKPFAQNKAKLDDLNARFRDKLNERLDAMTVEYPLGKRWTRRKNAGPSRLQKWFISSDCSLVLNHNSRGHMNADLQRYFFWSEYASFHKRSPSVLDVPKFLWPAHENLKLKPEDMPFIDRFRVQLRNRPSTTVVSHIAKDGHYYIHYEPKQCRSLSVREAARLQTFPDSYFFEGAATDQYRQVGNAVPPYLAHQIARLVHGILTGERGDVKKTEKISVESIA